MLELGRLQPYWKSKGFQKSCLVIIMKLAFEILNSLIKIKAVPLSVDRVESIQLEQGRDCGWECRLRWVRCLLFFLPVFISSRYVPNFDLML